MWERFPLRVYVTVIIYESIRSRICAKTKVHSCYVLKLKIILALLIENSNIINNSSLVAVHFRYNNSIASTSQ